ncbi:hypothetical protein ACFLQW_04515 [Candidatus Zixiibacteriota bacterium]
MRRSTLFLAFAVMFLLSSTAVLADVPDTINVQGLLTDGDGLPITSLVSVRLSIYDQESGGSELWAEEQDITPDEYGRFDVYLGTGTPAGLFGVLNAGVFSGSSRWLEIAPDGYDPLPRISFTTTPYAYRVATVNGSTGGKITGYLNVSGDLGVGTELPQARLHVGGTPGTDGIMFPDGTLQTTAAEGLPTDSLWVYSINVSSGGTITFTNLTGKTIYITSINVSGAPSATQVSCNVASKIFEFRMPPYQSYLWTGGGVPLALEDGETIEMTSDQFTRLTFVGFTE